MGECARRAYKNFRSSVMSQKLVSPCQHDEIYNINRIRTIVLVIPGYTDPRGRPTTKQRIGREAKRVVYNQACPDRAEARY